MKKIVAFCLAAMLLAAQPALAEGSELRYRENMETGVAGILEKDGTQFLVADSYDGSRILTCPLRNIFPEWIVYGGMGDVCEDGQGGLFAVFSANETPSDGMTYLVHLSEKGELLWSSLFEQQVNFGWVQLAPDGEGGVFLVHGSRDNYKESIVRYFDAAGTIQWKKLLTSEGLLFKPFVAHAGEKGSFRLYATTLSKSKGIYKTLEMVIDREGSITEVTARDYSFREDYSAKLFFDPEKGGIWFHSAAGYLGTLGTEEILLPMDALTECAPPNLLFRDVGPEVH